MYSLLIIFGCILTGAAIVWGIIHAWKTAKAKKVERVVKLDVRATVLHEHYVKHPNTAKEVGEALFGPETEEEKKRRAS